MNKITRKVHLDFHTGPDIPDIGTRFDKEQFQKVLKEGRVQSITLFAKCHHGHTYFPSKVGKMHPNLKFDLLGEQLKAAHEIGVTAPIYIPIGWSHLDAMEHPEWCSCDFETGEPHLEKIAENGNKRKPDTTWSCLCPSGEYLDLIAELTKEVCERYHPVDGLFFDICFLGICGCKRCKEGMKKAGLNPDSKEDAEIYYENMRIAMMKRLSDILYSYNKNAMIFFNGSCTYQNNPKFLENQSAFEIEVLPTVFGTMDLTDFIARKLERYHKDIFGMTARFQMSWGEIGGYKERDALKYEVANCLSLGAGAIVGDHCHPDGYMDEATYQIIGYTYSYMEKIEDYCLNTERVADVGIVIAKEQRANEGVNSFLIEQQIDYKIVENAEDLKTIRLLILPDNAIIDENLALGIEKFYQNGGAILASGSSLSGAFTGGTEYKGQSQSDVDYILPDFDIGLGSSVMVMHRSAHIVDGKRAGFIPRTKVFEPYFNRTYAHFSGHCNTPFQREPSKTVGLWSKKNFAYFAHDIFSLYNEYGSVYLRTYVLKVLNQLYPERLTVAKDLSTVGRLRLRKNEKEKFYALHLLYATQLRREKCFVLEDFPTFNQTKVELLLPEKIKSATFVQTGEDIPVIRDGRKTSLVIPEWKMHALIILKW